MLEEEIIGITLKKKNKKNKQKKEQKLNFEKNNISNKNQ